MIESKLYMNGHWMVSWIIYVDLKFKIAANTGLTCFCISF